VKVRDVGKSRRYALRVRKREVRKSRRFALWSGSKRSREE
jgi:hypothetical protein